MRYSQIFILAIGVLANQHSFAQIPELKILSPNSSEVNDSKSKTNFFHSNYSLAEALYFEKLEDVSFTKKYFLYFGNSLAANNKPILAVEFYNECYTSTEKK